LQPQALADRFVRGRGSGREFRSVMLDERLNRRRLHTAGVPVAHHVVDDMNHGFMGTTATLPAISATLDVVRLWLRNRA